MLYIRQPTKILNNAYFQIKLAYSYRYMQETYGWGTLKDVHVAKVCAQEKRILCCINYIVLPL